MVTVAKKGEAYAALRRSLARTLMKLAVIAAVVGLFFGACTARVAPNEWGVEQKQFGRKVGIVEHVYGPGRYLVGPGTTMHVFPREIHVLEASYERDEALSKASGGDVKAKVEAYYDRRERILGDGTHRVIEALNIQTSDGYSVLADVSLLYVIADPVKVARDFGWSGYVDAFAVNTFRNGVLSTLGKMNAESFYDEKIRVQQVAEAEALVRERFRERGFQVERLLLRNYRYAPSYERSLHDKKVAVQLAVKNEKERLVNEEKAKLQRIESQGNARITIADSEVAAQIAQIRAEAELYASQVRARADRDVKVAEAEAKRLKAGALTESGSRYVVGLETSKMFANIQGAVMTPDQYIQFVRAAWALIGLDPGRPPPAPAKGPPATAAVQGGGR